MDLNLGLGRPAPAQALAVSPPSRDGAPGQAEGLAVATDGGGFVFVLHGHGVLKVCLLMVLSRLRGYQSKYR